MSEPILMNSSVFSTLEDLRKQKAAIDNNPLLSETGRKQSAAQIEATRQAYADKALNTFKGDWQELRRVYSDLKADREQIAEASAKRWDYARLNYARETAIGIIRKAQSPQDVQDGYEAVKLSGDRHAARAFVETALSLDRQFSDKVAQHEVKQAMQREAERLTTSPEMEAHRQAESKLSGDIAKLYKATQQAANEFYPSYLYSGNNPFTDLLKGVKVTEKIDSATLATTRTVDVNWD